MGSDLLHADDTPMLEIVGRARGKARVPGVALLPGEDRGDPGHVIAPGARIAAERRGAARPGIAAAPRRRALRAAPVAAGLGRGGGLGLLSRGVGAGRFRGSAPGPVRFRLGSRRAHALRPGARCAGLRRRGDRRAGRRLLRPLPLHGCHRPGLHRPGRRRFGAPRRCRVSVGRLRLDRCGSPGIGGVRGLRRAGRDLPGGGRPDPCLRGGRVGGRRTGRAPRGHRPRWRDRGSRPRDRLRRLDLQSVGVGGGWLGGGSRLVPGRLRGSRGSRGRQLTQCGGRGLGRSPARALSAASPGRAFARHTRCASDGK